MAAMIALLAFRGMQDSIVIIREVQQTSQTLILKKPKKEKNNKPKWLLNAHHLNIAVNSRVTDAAMVEALRMAP